jgi:hypothetical protein
LTPNSPSRPSAPIPIAPPPRSVEDMKGLF